MIYELGYILLLLLVLPYIESASRRPLNEYIRHFEPLNYDTEKLHNQHQRARRSTDSEVRLRFRAHGRKFHLRLKRDLTAFSEDFKIENSNGDIQDVDSSHIYQGELVDEPESVVFGSVQDGKFEGKIMANDGSYYVELARRFLPKNVTTKPNDKFHSVIYKDGDIEDPYAHLRHGHVGGCGINSEIGQWMERIQNSAVEDVTSTSPSAPPAASPHRHTAPSSPQPHPNSLFEQYHHFRHSDGSYKYSREANTPLSREKRASSRLIKDDNKNTCSLFIQTDPLIWRHVREGFPDHRDPLKRLEVDIKTREEILSMIAHHVTAVNYIYRATKFDGRMEHRNIKFEVQRIKIDDDAACNGYMRGGANNGEANQFCMENIDVSNFLNLHSLGNHEDFCLAYVFTYRDFTGGTLGLAWVASASGASGGICEKYKTYTETVGGAYQSTRRSLNTGIITFVNYNSRVPPKVSQLTLAHEIGHNFGSPHDYPTECRPGGNDGNFIMFASATSGDRPNNSKFSACSVANISAVLDAVRDGRKRNCLKESAGAFCGNTIVEEGEECDCGYDELECKDKCCYPRVVSDMDRQINGSARGCHRRANTQCSPSQGPCCSGNTCSYVPASSQTVCKSSADCHKAAVCSGKSPMCPEPPPRPEKTSCNNGTQICVKGECSGSICDKWGMRKCFLSSSVSRGEGVKAVLDPRALCQLACATNADPSSCRSTAEFAKDVGLPEGGISLRPGSPCDNFQGYCDVFLKCRPVDAEGPLVRLKNLLLDRATLRSLADWVTEHWWGVMLVGIGVILGLGAFIKCCAVHTPSSNPKRAPARRLADTLTLRRVPRRRSRHRQDPYGPAYPPRSSNAPPPRPPYSSSRVQNPPAATPGAPVPHPGRARPTRTPHKL